MDAQQLPLLAGYYRCQHCGATVDHVQRERRWWLCDACHTAIVPDFEIVTTEAERERNRQYFAWREEMERRYPAVYVPPRSHVARVPSIDDVWPFCACGAERRESRFGRQGISLFGGTRQQYCPVCEAKREIESVYGMMLHLHDEWDDEDWLDYLERHYADTFAVGVMPDYWFRLKYGDAA